MGSEPPNCSQLNQTYVGRFGISLACPLHLIPWNPDDLRTSHGQGMGTSSQIAHELYLGAHSRRKLEIHGDPTTFPTTTFFLQCSQSSHMISIDIWHIQTISHFWILRSLVMSQEFKVGDGYFVSNCSILFHSSWRIFDSESLEPWQFWQCFDVSATRWLRNVIWNGTVSAAKKIAY